ncbi:MAG: DUF350 domain-containing protein [Verrucomicrobiota bacterium]
MKELFLLEPLDALYDWQAFLYLILCLVLVGLASWLYGKARSLSLSQQLCQADNPATAISFAGYLAALGIVLSGVMSTPSAEGVSGLGGDLLNSALWSLGAMALLLIALRVNDRLLFARFSNRKEIVEDRNAGLGAVEAASFIGTALLLRASLAEQAGDPPLGEPWLTLIYFLAGQLLFFLFSLVYQRITRFHLIEELEKDNPAVGVAFGGTLVAYAILLGFCITHYDSLTSLLLWGLAAALLLALVRWLTHWLLFRRSSLDHELRQDRNWGAGIIEATLSITVALILIAAL